MAVSMTWRRAAALLIALAGLAVAPLATAEAERRLPASSDEVRLSYAPLVKSAAPAVVNIYAKRMVQSRRRSPLFDDPFFRRFFGDDFFGGQQRQQSQNSLGSGVIVRADGVIVTNHHVIQGATEITVVLNDRREFGAEVLLTDEKTDLAVLTIDPQGADLQHLDFADSDDLEVGDIVLAIGNPFGVGQTVTQGIVSALARTNVSREGLQAFIQTDAAINPGNSGGALIAIGGGLIGINTAIFSRSGGSHGIGFAIPSNLVEAVVNNALMGGEVVRPWFGASGQPVTADLAMSLGLDRPGGVLINRLHPDGPAAKAGLTVGDVLLAVDGHTVADLEELKFRIATLEIGGMTEVDLLRKGRTLKASLELEPPPEDPPRNLTLLSDRHPLQGAEVANLSPALGEELGFNALEVGVVVTRIRRGTAAHRLRLRPGDILVALNDIDIESVGQLVDLLRVDPGSWRFTVRRGRRTVNLVVRS